MCVCVCLCARACVGIHIVRPGGLVHHDGLFFHTGKRPPAHNARTHTGKAMNVKLGRPEVMHQHIAIALAIYMN